MTNHSFGFLQHLINDGQLKPIDHPQFGCMVIYFDHDNNIIDSIIVQDEEPRAAQYARDNASYGFYASLTPLQLKEAFVKFLQSNPEMVTYKIHS